MQLLFLLTILSIAPGILILMTSFTRIIIVLSFVRTVLVHNPCAEPGAGGTRIISYFFIMSPIFLEINETALQPYLDGEIGQEEAMDSAALPMKEFMAKHTREKDLALFYKYAELEKPESIAEIPLTSLIPAFAISELKTAFQIGFVIFIPFLIIDMVVASTLMAMG
nr:flagellar biosynthetic protein FliP [Planococcus salinarum]